MTPAQTIAEILDTNLTNDEADYFNTIFRVAIANNSRESKVARFDADGYLTHVFCYYHKQWEDVSEVPYATNGDSLTGLKNMCREGNRLWSQKHYQYKKKVAALRSTGAQFDADVRRLKLECKSLKSLNEA